jgi:hypothetical protein
MGARLARIGRAPFPGIDRPRRYNGRDGAIKERISRADDVLREFWSAIG